MTINEKQEELNNLWMQYKSGTIKAYTGFGKTVLTAKIINKLLENETGRIVILVDRTALVSQWRTRISEFCNEIHQESVTVLTIQYCIANNVRFTDLLLLVIDEIHNFYSTERLPYLTGKLVNNCYTLGLSATPEDEVIRSNTARELINSLDKFKIIAEITRDEGIANGWTKPIDEFVLTIPFGEEDMQLYNKYDKDVRTLYGKYCRDNNLAYFNTKIAAKPSVGLHDISTMYRNVKFNYIVNNKTYSTNETLIDFAYKHGWKPEIWSKSIKGRSGYNPIYDVINSKFNPYIMWLEARRLKLALVSRNELIWNNKVKVETAVKLCELFNDKKILIFNQRKAVCDKITELLNTNGETCLSYHSSLKKKQNTETLRRFTNSEIKILSSVSAANTGIDVPDIEVTISVAAVKNPNTYTQSVGRIRQHGIAITIAMRDTKEEEDVLKRTRGSDKIQWLNNINEIVDIC